MICTTVFQRRLKSAIFCRTTALEGRRTQARTRVTTSMPRVVIDRDLDGRVKIIRVSRGFARKEHFGTFSTLFSRDAGQKAGKFAAPNYAHAPCSCFLDGKHSARDARGSRRENECGVAGFPGNG